MGACLPARRLLPKRSRSSHRITQICIGCFIFVALIYQTQQSIAASQHFENDARLPYSYATNRDLVSLMSWLFQLSEMTRNQRPNRRSNRPRLLATAVVSTNV